MMRCELALQIGVELVMYLKSTRPQNQHMGKHLKACARVWADELGEPLPDHPDKPDCLVDWFATIWLHRIVDEIDHAE